MFMEIAKFTKNISYLFIDEAHCISTSDAVFLADFYSMGNKIYKITKLSDRVVQFKNWGVTYWAKRNRQMVVWIIRELKSWSKNRFL